MADQEAEAALVVYAQDPQDVVRHLAGLQTLGEFALVPERTKSIHDVYYDTPERLFRGRGLSLRLRQVDTQPRLTLKGPPRSLPRSGVERLEIEDRWSKAILARVIRELAGAGLALPPPPDGGDLADPQAVLRRMGLQVVQDRETERILRNVVPRHEEARAPLAEVDIDSVLYHLGRRPVRLHEVEIEAKQAGDPEVIHRVEQALIREFGARLRTWKYGKLTTGEAIERLLDRGALDGLLDPEGLVRPGGLACVARELGRPL